MDFRFVLLITVLFLTELTIAQTIACHPNEEFKECESACPPTCQNKSLKICTDQCIIGCSCKKGYIRRAPGDLCVPEACEGVPVCKKNERFTTCATACPKICNETRVGPCTLECTSGCVCADGYILDKKGGNCVPIDQCPPRCEENEVYKMCGTACPATCSQFVRPCAKNCVQGCFCKDGYVLDDNSKKCIKKEDCPKCSSRAH